MSNLARKYQTQEVQQPSRIGKTAPKKSKVTKGEKLFYSIFAIAVFLMSVQIISNQASVYQVNKDIQIVESDISEQQKVTQDLQSQVNELSEYGRLLEAAKKQGLSINENNVKVVLSEQ